MAFCGYRPFLFTAPYPFSHLPEVVKCYRDHKISDSCSVLLKVPFSFVLARQEIW